MNEAWMTVDQEVAERFGTLVAAGVVSSRAAEVATGCLALLHDRVVLRGETEALTMFATHLVMALQRAADGVALAAVEVPSDDLAQLDAGLSVADEIMDICRLAGFALPEQERILIALHVTSMTGSPGGEAS